MSLLLLFWAYATVLTVGTGTVLWCVAFAKHLMRLEERRLLAVLDELGLQQAGSEAHSGTWRGQALRVVRRRMGSDRERLSVGITVPTGGLVLDSTPARGGIGDPEFDAHFRAKGEFQAISLLMAPVRSALLKTPGQLRIAHGTLWVDVPIDKHASHDVLMNAVEHVLDPLVEVAARISQARAMSLHDRFIEWVMDAEPDVRRMGIGLIGKHGAPVPDYVGASLRDTDAGVRNAAAELLGDTATLLSVALDEGVPVKDRQRAVLLLARSGTEAERAAAALALASTGDTLARSALTLCESLGAKAEPIILSLLDLERARFVRGAVRWAARHGSAATLPSLRRIARVATTLSPLAFDAVRAVHAVRSRAVGLVGAVTLSAEEAAEGALSLASEAGLLSQVDSMGP